MWPNDLSHPLFVALGAYALMSGFTLIVYRIDKTAAGRGERRISENALHVLELLGGWPGALIGMQVLHHKRRNVGFVAIVCLIGLVHVAGWVWWIGGR